MKIQFNTKAGFLFETGKGEIQSVISSLDKASKPWYVAVITAGAALTYNFILEYRKLELENNYNFQRIKNQNRIEERRYIIPEKNVLDDSVKITLKLIFKDKMGRLINTDVFRYRDSISKTFINLGYFHVQLLKISNLLSKNFSINFNFFNVPLLRASVV